MGGEQHDDKPVSSARASLIAREAADQAIERHTKALPDMMRPVMFEVANHVAAEARKDVVTLLNGILGADVEDKDHIRDINKDLFYLRDKRVTHEKAISTAYDNIVGSVSKWGLGAVFLGLLAYFGIKIKG